MHKAKNGDTKIIEGRMNTRYIFDLSSAPCLKNKLSLFLAKRRHECHYFVL